MSVEKYEQWTLIISANGSQILSGRAKKARRFICGGGLEYYVVGRTGADMPHYGNMVLRHAISRGRKAMEMVRWL